MELTSPFILAALFALGLGIIAFFAMPGPQRIRVYDSGSGGPNLGDRLRSSLSGAGIFNKSPSIFTLGLVGASALVGGLLWFFLGAFYYLILGPIVVMAIFFTYLGGAQRRHQKAVYEELVPFLNRISATVTAGQPIQKAYMDGVAESKALRPILSDSAAKMASGGEFVPCLMETLPLINLRSWTTFVRQMELHQTLGGDLETALQSTSNQLSKVQRLQAETRADFAMQEKSQRLIIAIVAFGLFSMFFATPGGAERLASVFGTTMGIVMALASFATMVFGMWFLKKQLKDVEKKLSQ